LGDYCLVIDNLMDLTHETYVHQGSIGQKEILEAPIETQAEGNSVTVTRWMANIDAPPFCGDALKKPGAVDRWQICDAGFTWMSPSWKHSNAPSSPTHNCV
jgi:phenylpropionate dioxygenase-like ring-hydroxylating dioxygenase large terminal subunit